MHLFAQKTLKRADTLRKQVKENFFLDIKDGALSVEEGEHDNPGLSLTFDSEETMEKVFSGDQQAAMGAFMQGKVKFAGDMSLGQKLGSVFKAPE